MIPYNKQFIDKSDKKKVLNSLSDKFIATGPKIIEFENIIKKKTGSKFAHVCNSGTSALHLAFLSIGLQKDDNIIMPSINFVASFNICKILKANVFLADVDPLLGVMTPETFSECVKKNKINKIKAIVVMHLGGHPMFVEDFYRIKKKNKCFLIEDSCHAFGSKYMFKKSYFPVGSCKHSDISTFSFHAVKTFTTGEGGAITTNNKDLSKKIFLERSHCIYRKSKKKYWEYDVVGHGFNFRMSDINCALGLSQIKKINLFIKRRKQIANYYVEKLKKYKDIITCPNVKKTNHLSSWHLFIISINFKKLKTTKDEFLLFLNKRKIFCQFHYIPIYKFSIAKTEYSKLKNAEYYYNNSVSIPIYYSLLKKDLDNIIQNISKFLDKKIKTRK